MVKSTYGYDIESNDDEYIKLVSEGSIAIGSLGVPGLNLVDTKALCKFVNGLLNIVEAHGRQYVLCLHGSLAGLCSNRHELRETWWTE